MHAKKSSKILNEFSNLVSTGTNKISFLQFNSEMFSSEKSQGQSSQATQRYETFISKHLSQIRMPLVRPSAKLYSSENFAEHAVHSSKQSKKVIITF